MSAIAIGSFPPDSASSVRATRRRMCVEAQGREDRGRVRRGDDRAEQERLEPGHVEEHVRGNPGQDRAHDHSDRAEERRGDRHLTEPAPRGLEPALVQDQREPDDADLAGELGVVELDAARPVRPEQHPEAQERDEHGQSGARSAERDDDAGPEDGAAHEKDEPLVHGPILSTSRASRRVSTTSGSIWCLLTAGRAGTARASATGGRAGASGAPIRRR